MPIHQEGVRDSNRIPDMNLMPQEDLQAYLNASATLGDLIEVNTLITTSPNPSILSA